MWASGVKRGLSFRSLSQKTEVLRALWKRARVADAQWTLYGPTIGGSAKKKKKRKRGGKLVT